MIPPRFTVQNVLGHTVRGAALGLAFTSATLSVSASAEDEATRSQTKQWNISPGRLAVVL